MKRIKYRSKLALTNWNKCSSFP